LNIIFFVYNKNILKNKLKNMSQNITCPSCKTIIDLDKLSQEKYKLNLEKEFEKEREEMRKKAIEFAKSEAEKQAQKDSKQMQNLNNIIEEQKKKQEESDKQELKLLKRQRELEQKTKNAELEMNKKIEEERKKIETDLSKEIEENSKKILDEKLEKIQEENRKKELEMLKQQEQMKKTIDDLKRKSEQASQQIQGDIAEDDIRDALKSAFPIDDINDVSTWVKWADLIQNVKNNIGQKAWIIVWESKNTKTWTDSWIMKLKDDKLKVKWNIAILVTTTLPKNISNFGMMDDVMVCLPKYVIPVASMLREKLIAVAKTEKSLEWKDIKMEMLYKYLSSEEFSSKIWMMVDVFSQLKIGIDSERRAMEKNWKKREKDLERATYAITWVYWELESLMGQNLSWSEKLELPEAETKE